MVREAGGLAEGVHGFGLGGVEGTEVDGVEEGGVLGGHGYSSILIIN